MNLDSDRVLGFLASSSAPPTGITARYCASFRVKSASASSTRLASISSRNDNRGSRRALRCISLVAQSAKMSPDLQGDALLNTTVAHDSGITVRAYACTCVCVCVCVCLRIYPSQRRPFPSPLPPPRCIPHCRGRANYKKFPGKFYSRFTHRRRIGDGGVIHRRGLPAARAASPPPSSLPPPPPRVDTHATVRDTCDIRSRAPKQRAFP